MSQQLENVRLPAWLLPLDWPKTGGQPALARVDINEGIVTAVGPSIGAPVGTDFKGALVLPGLLEPHAHLDKTYTRGRLGEIKPGLLAAIEATQDDSARWDHNDLHQRITRALEQAKANGVTHLRTHVDCFGQQPPRAWDVLNELGGNLAFVLERVALVPLPLFRSATDARRIVRSLVRDDQALPTVMGAFIHTSNFDEQCLLNVLVSAEEAGLDLDLHIDEELSLAACGLETVARLARSMKFSGRIVCSHTCALSIYPQAKALAILDDVARAPITLIALPATNLYLQDAESSRTPRLRGLTLVKEAFERSIPVLFGGDNVQDAFCPLGNYDPLATLQLAVLTAQLDDAFDTWSQAICRADWLSGSHQAPNLVGSAANFTLLHSRDAYSWPAETARSVMGQSSIPDTFTDYLRGLS